MLRRYLLGIVCAAKGSPCRALSAGTSNRDDSSIPPEVRFDSPHAVTRGKSTWEVLRGWLVFKLFTYDILVDNSLKVGAQDMPWLARWLNPKDRRLTTDPS